MKKQSGGRCNYKNWPIRRQLMISFLCTTILLQLIIICVIFVMSIKLIIAQLNLKSMKENTNSEVLSKVNERTQKELTTIAINIREVGNSFQAYLFNIGSILSGLRQMFTLFVEPTNKTPNSPLYSCAIPTNVDYSKSCYYVPSTSSQTFGTFNRATEDLLLQLNQYNDLLPSFITPTLRQQIQSLSLLIIDEQNSVHIQLVYPAQPINGTYNPLIMNWYKKTNEQPESIVLIGPYQFSLQPNSNQTLLSLAYKTSFSKPLQTGGTLVYNLIFQIEFTTTSIRWIFAQLNYLPSAEVAVTDRGKNIIYAPSYWNTNFQTSINKIFDFKDFSGITIMQIIPSNLTIFEVTRKARKSDLIETFQMLQVPLAGVYRSLELSAFLNQTTRSNYIISDQTELFIYMYTKTSEMLKIHTLIEGIILHEETVIILLTLCSCINTVAIVFIFTYMVAVKISRPLRKLIFTAAQMSTMATQKNVTSKILAELDEIDAQNQILDLIQAFKNLVKTIEQRNNTQKSTAKQQVIHYPLNQYDPEFINKTKGISDINWHNVINEIEDE